MAEVKETKAQRVERLKRSKNAWEHFDEIREFARQGIDSVPAEWKGTYFRCTRFTNSRRSIPIRTAAFTAVSEQRESSPHFLQD